MLLLLLVRLLVMLVLVLQLLLVVVMVAVATTRRRSGKRARVLEVVGVAGVPNHVHHVVGWDIHPTSEMIFPRSPEDISEAMNGGQGGQE